ncbi:hypothetical protein [Paenibacillus sp. NPDC057967]|uniref:hypothetical protein n=1 Tax=Paenibacillus sp. NPDC057967 TaxID=3346293 RepID=UPI0036D9E063
MNEGKDVVVEGFNVLSVNGSGGTDGGLISLGIILGVLGLALLIVSLISEEGAVGFFGLLLLLIAFIAFANADDPVQYEVTVQPGHVIDAARWEIVEQRGQIYVITEREAAE